MVDLKIFDLEGNEIDILSGFDFGLSQINIANKIPFKIKNEGDTDVLNATISSEPLNTVEEVGQEEYDRQVIASSWKTFGLNENGEFKTKIELGDIKAGCYVEGVKTEDIAFSSASNCQFETVWENGLTEYRNNIHKFHKGEGVHLGIMGKRMRHKVINSAKDIELKMNMDFLCTTENQSATLPFISMPCRINAKGTGFGYMFMFQYRRTDNKFKVTVYKDAKGMVDYEDRVYGKPMFDTILWQTFDKNKPISFKIYDNPKPTFEVKYDEERLKLGKVGDSAINGYSMTDTSSGAYEGNGNFYWETSLYDGDYSVSTSNMCLMTEELEQPIFIKTVVGSDSINRTEYNTATTISYVER